MKHKQLFFTLVFLIMLLSSCTTTFAGSLFILNFRDIILYVGLAFIMALLVAFKSSEKRKAAFWIWFILSLLLTPLAGFIYLLIQFSRKSKD